MRAGPSGEERFTPHYTVPVSPQCPQEISLLTLPVFQGAAVSSEHFSQSLPPRNVAELDAMVQSWLRLRLYASPDRSAPGSSRESAHGRGPSIEKPCSGRAEYSLWPDFSPRRLSMGDSRQEGSPLTGSGHDLSPPLGVVELWVWLPRGHNS